jgi:hypothetical protein
MAEPIANYTFVPWLRRGIAAHVSEADHLGAGASAAIFRASLGVDLELAAVPVQGAATPANPVIHKDLSLLGPGDVAGLRREAILRMQPGDGERNFESNGLAYVEFYAEDLPWRFTPAAPTGSKLRPWIALWVLQEDEFTLAETARDALPALTLDSAKAAAALPPAAESWAWAHAQIGKSVGAVTDVGGVIRDNPNNAVSRLICPRRLMKGLRYHAFVVPAFETGRLVGLGLDPSTTLAQQPSWGGTPGQMPWTWPFYHHWTFHTGELGDFETLVRALVPGPVGPSFGKRDVDGQAPGFGMDGYGSATYAVEGALRPPDYVRAPFPAVPGAAFTQRLQNILDLPETLGRGEDPGLDHPYHQPGPGAVYASTLPDDPIVVPPAYGKLHLGVSKVSDTEGASEHQWLRELNLDPRNRVAAGLGTQVVQQRQEELTERAWKQLGALEDTNERLRVAELGVALGEALYAKHMVRTDEERVLRLVAPAHRRMIGTAGRTMHAEMGESQVPLASQSATFKRITRPQRKLIRRLTGSGSVQGFHQGIVGRFNDTEAPLQAAPPKPPPDAALELPFVVQAVQDAAVAYEAEAERSPLVFLDLLVAEMRARFEDLATLPVLTFRAAMRTRLDARIPPAPPDDRRQEVLDLIDAITSYTQTGTDAVEVRLATAAFQAAYGAQIAGKSSSGVTVRPLAPGAVTETSPSASSSGLLSFQQQLSHFGTQAVEMRLEPAAPLPLSAVSTLNQAATASIRPATALTARVLSALSGVAHAALPHPRPLRPVMAHPTFPDPMFEDLRKISQDFILPNYADLPVNTITLLETNQRFVQSYLAGLNHEMARELLWREYPTDQRGTYFKTFWDTRDDLHGTARPDIFELPSWSGELGAQSDSSGYLVLVIRGELLRRYPGTVVYAQRAVFAAAGPMAPRELAPLDELSDAELRAQTRFPVFRGDLQPDIALFGFALDKQQARGDRSTDPGWFFVLEERPGEVNFGLDDDGPPGATSWNELHWGRLSFPATAPQHISLAANAISLLPGGSPEEPTAGVWGRTSADMAYILLQNPVRYARHASELLP